MEPRRLAELLDDLKAKGYGHLVGKKAGQDSVGLYLETNRNTISMPLSRRDPSAGLAILQSPCASRD